MLNTQYTSETVDLIDYYILFEFLIFSDTVFIAIQNTYTISRPPENAHCCLKIIPIKRISPVIISDAMSDVKMVDIELETIYFTRPFVLHGLS